MLPLVTNGHGLPCHPGGLPCMGLRTGQLDQLERDLRMLGAELTRIVAAARRRRHPRGAQVACAKLAGELQDDQTLLLLRLRRLEDLEEERWEERRTDLERSIARMRLALRRLGLKLLQR